ncbi:hypothetical protein QEN19_003760 [Hanseniaspora menglaensis]
MSHTKMSSKILKSIHKSAENNKISILNSVYNRTDLTNVTASITRHVGRNLHLKNQHPINNIRKIIEKSLDSTTVKPFVKYNDFTPVVTIKQNFDDLGFPKDHPGRSKSDTYYIDDEHLLRTHTSAHEIECFQKMKELDNNGYLISADVYRRDEIDKSHYPVFHQMEGSKTWARENKKNFEEINEEIANMKKQLDQFENLTISDIDYTHEPNSVNCKQNHMNDEETSLLISHMKRSLELVVANLFIQRYSNKSVNGPNETPEIKMRWIEAYFPWTQPSFEIEVFFNGEWLEICGCGLVRELAYKNSGFTAESQMGWAFGIGLDRMAMLLYDIPDIRLLWSEDDRFLNQFKNNEGIFKFKPFSNHAVMSRDVSFWLNNPVHLNDFMELVREELGDMVESCSLVDEFVHKKTGRKSQCFRINYQHLDRNLTNEEVNDLHSGIELKLVKQFGAEIRN